MVGGVKGSLSSLSLPRVCSLDTIHLFYSLDFITGCFVCLSFLVAVIWKGLFNTKDRIYHLVYSCPRTLFLPPFSLLVLLYLPDSFPYKQTHTQKKKNSYDRRWIVFRMICTLRILLFHINKIEIWCRKKVRSSFNYIIKVVHVHNVRIVSKYTYYYLCVWANERFFKACVRKYYASVKKNWWKKLKYSVSSIH